MREARRIGPGTAAGRGQANRARLVALMGGEIGQDGEAAAAGGGALRFEMPAPGAPAGAAAAPVAAPPGMRPATRRLRILAVDDSPANLAVLRALLSTTGFLLETAAEAPPAIEAIAAAAGEGRPFDLVLMDVMMPGMDGHEATRRIRDLPGAAAGVPVIAVTASVFPEDVAACRASGMDGHVPKPVERNSLLRAIAGAVDDGTAGADGLAALRPLFLAELGARLAAIAAGEAPALETIHAIAGTIGHLGEADLLEDARAATRAFRSEAPETPALLAALAADIAARFPAIAPPSATAA